MVLVDIGNEFLVVLRGIQRFLTEDIFVVSGNINSGETTVLSFSHDNYCTIPNNRGEGHHTVLILMDGNPAEISRQHIIVRTFHQLNHATTAAIIVANKSLRS